MAFPHWNEHMLSTVDKRPRSVFTSDAEEHTRFRRMLSKPFTFKRVEGLRPAIQEVTDECIDAILAGPQPADMVAKLALPVPTRVISEMLGVPYEDHEFFQHHANVGLARYATAEAGQKGAMSLHQYLIDLVKKKMETSRGKAQKTRCRIWRNASMRARSASRKRRSSAPGC
jgi:cytochrome P450